MVAVIIVATATATATSTTTAVTTTVVTTITATWLKVGREFNLNSYGDNDDIYNRGCG
jgi:hypothetical protein